MLDTTKLGTERSIRAMKKQAEEYSRMTEGFESHKEAVALLHGLVLEQSQTISVLLHNVNILQDAVIELSGNKFFGKKADLSGLLPVGDIPVIPASEIDNSISEGENTIILTGENDAVMSLQDAPVENSAEKENEDENRKE